VAYVFLPEFDPFGFERRRAEAQARAQRVELRVQRLAETARLLEEMDAAHQEGPLADAPGELKRIADELARGAVTEKESLAQVVDLRRMLEERYNKLAQANRMPKFAMDPAKLGAAADMASAIQQGQFGQAAKKAQELQEKIENGELSTEQAAALVEGLRQLAQVVGLRNPDLAKALAQAAECLGSLAMDMSEGQRLECMQAALAALKELELSLEELEALLIELEGLAMACAGMGRCLGQFAGIGGQWREGESDQFGPGMGGPGRGVGGSVGELPDVDGSFRPDMLRGPLTPGDILLSVEQQGPPDEAAEATLGYLEGAFLQAGQEAEQALEREEIPRGSREFVRQYFGTLEQQSPQPLAEAIPSSQ